MKFRGTFVSQASGALNGLVAASVKGGVQVLRRRPSSRRAASPLQEVVRSVVRSLSQAWSQDLTEAQRATWETYAQNVTVINSVGNTIHLAGNNWFVANNVSRLNQNGSIAQISLARVDEFTGTFDRGNPTAFEPGNAEVSYDNLGNGTLSFNPGTVPITADPSSQSAFLLYASTPFSAGRVRPVGPYNLVLAVNANSTSPTHNFTLPPNLITNATTPKQDYTLRLTRADGRLSSVFTVQGFPLP